MVNKVILIGNVGRDPEVRYLDNETAVASFSLATSESYKDKNGEWQSKTEWHNIVAWRNTAKYVESKLKKGIQVFIEGKLTTRSWDDKEGNKRYTTEVVASSIRLLGKKEDNGGVDYSATANSEAKMHDIPNIENSTDDDLPF
jgi:single-strand DNA-binding protein